MQSRRPVSADTRPPDYSHRFHAGNIGDVWKHCVLVATLQAVASGNRVEYLESHAGEGRYPLGPTGEWTEGVGRLWGAAAGGPVVDGYRDCIRQDNEAAALGPRRYPGSPALAAALLGPTARLSLWEREEGTAQRLASVMRGDPRVRVCHGDGLDALPAALAARAPADELVVLMDPPYATKAEWLAVSDALIAAARSASNARLLLWYPIKSLTRPNAMLARLEAGGVTATAVELITTPLSVQRNRLNGSGVVMVQPPEGALAAIAAAAPFVGRQCATQRGAWSVRMQSWVGAPPAGANRAGLIPPTDDAAGR